MPTDVIGTTIEGEAWLHLLRVERKLAELKKLATPDTFQQFVWELNDFISSARKVSNYLLKELGRPSGFEGWVKNQLKLLRAVPRNKYFYDLRNISDKVCTITPSQEVHGTEIVDRVVVQEGTEPDLKDPKTGEAIARARIAVKGLSEEERTLTITRNTVKYFLEGWPDEDILTFLDRIVDALRTLVYSAYEAYPNSFQLHRMSGQRQPKSAS